MSHRLRCERQAREIGRNNNIYKQRRTGSSLIAAALADWIRESIRKGAEAFYVNIMFDHLSRSNGAHLDQMRDAVQHAFYEPFCTRFAHHPKAPAERHKLPKLWLFPDLPVYKREKTSLRDVSINGGLHYNGIMLIQSPLRKGGAVIEHITREQNRYARQGISRIDVRPIDENIEKACDYATKTVKAGHVDPDHGIVLPRALSEVRKNVIWLNPRDRVIRDIQSSDNLSRELAETIYENRKKR